MFLNVSSIFQMLKQLKLVIHPESVKEKEKEMEKMFLWNIHNCDTEMQYLCYSYV